MGEANQADHDGHKVLLTDGVLVGAATALALGVAAGYDMGSLAVCRLPVDLVHISHGGVLLNASWLVPAALLVAWAFWSGKSHLRAADAIADMPKTIMDVVITLCTIIIVYICMGGLLLSLIVAPLWFSGALWCFGVVAMIIHTKTRATGLRGADAIGPARKRWMFTAQITRSLRFFRALCAVSPLPSVAVSAILLLVVSTLAGRLSYLQKEWFHVLCADQTLILVRTIDESKYFCRIDPALHRFTGDFVVMLNDDERLKSGICYRKLGVITPVVTD